MEAIKTLTPWCLAAGAGAYAVRETIAKAIGYDPKTHAGVVGCWGAIAAVLAVLIVGLIIIWLTSPSGQEESKEMGQLVAVGKEFLRIGKDSECSVTGHCEPLPTAIKAAFARNYAEYGRSLEVLSKELRDEFRREDEFDERALRSLEKSARHLHRMVQAVRTNEATARLAKNSPDIEDVRARGERLCDIMLNKVYGNLDIRDRGTAGPEERIASAGKALDEFQSELSGFREAADSALEGALEKIKERFES